MSCKIYDSHFYWDLKATTRHIAIVFCILFNLAVQRIFLKVGNKIGDVSYTIQQYTESFGYGVVRELVGHGLGKKLHEEPEIPNFGSKGTGPEIKNGLVVAIEPMINMGTKNVRQLFDGWTIGTKDKKPSAHFEHNIAVINNEPVLLSTFDYINQKNN